MIQRKQSLFLLASSILCLVSITGTFMNFSFQGTSISLTGFQIIDEQSIVFANSPNIYTLGITILACFALNLTTIFLYKTRQLQMKLTRYAIVLKIAIVAIVAYFSYIILGVNEQIQLSPQIGVFAILAAIIFDWLAYAAIKKDEELIRSIDRIR